MRVKGLVERLGQMRYRRQVDALCLPAVVDALPGGRAAPAARAFDHALVGERLQLFQAFPGPAGELAGAAGGAHQALDLALVA